MERGFRPETQRAATVSDLENAHVSYKADLKQRMQKVNEHIERSHKVGTWEEGDYDYMEGEEMHNAAREHLPFIETLDKLRKDIGSLGHALDEVSETANRMMRPTALKNTDARELLQAWQKLNEKLSQLPQRVVLRTK